MLAILAGRWIAGDTTGTARAAKGGAFTAVAEQLDYGRRYTVRTNHEQFEDLSVKQQSLDLVIVA